MGFDLKCTRCDFTWADETAKEAPEACPVCGSRLAPRSEADDLAVGPYEPPGLSRTGEGLALASFVCMLAIALAAMAPGAIGDLLTAGIAFLGLALGLLALITALVGQRRAGEFPAASPARKKAARALALSALAFIAWALPIAMWVWVTLKSRPPHSGALGD
jgi:hypothetical protein